MSAAMAQHTSSMSRPAGLRATLEGQPARSLRIGDRKLKPTFFDGQLLMGTPEQALEDGGALFVLHADSLAAERVPLVSRVLWESGEVTWTARFASEGRPF